MASTPASYALTITCFCEGDRRGRISVSFWQTAFVSPSAPCCGFGESARYFAELSTNCTVIAQRPPGVTPTTKLTDPAPVLPAMSVAVADRLTVPVPKLHAGPVTSAQVELATPERASAARQVMLTFCSRP